MWFSTTAGFPHLHFFCFQRRMGRQAEGLTGVEQVALPPGDAAVLRTVGRKPWLGSRVVTEEISTEAAWVLCILQTATSFMLPLINFPQLLKVNDLASRDSQITGAEPPLPASMGHLSVTFIYWINPPVSSRRTTAKWPLIVGWCADETNLQRDYKPLFLPLLLLSLRDQQ